MNEDHKETMAPQVDSANRNYKDTLFRMLFQDKEALLELYNAVNNTNYLDSGDLEIITLENAIYMNMKNDLAFLISFQLHMYEHQSTINPNMPLRFLHYASREYRILIDRNATYRSKQIKLPSPHFVVFYNGTAEQPERQELRLSDAYEVADTEPNLELKVLVLNINNGKNPQLMEQCKTLKEYMLYVERVRKYVLQSEIEVAVDQAINECIKEGILVDFLEKNRSEAKNMCIFEYHEEEVLKLIRSDEREIAREEILKEVNQKIQDTILNANSKVQDVIQDANLKIQDANLKVQDANHKLVKIVCKMFLKGSSVNDIADFLEENVDYIQFICDIAKRFAPDYDVEAIYAQVMEQHSSNMNQITGLI